MTRNSASEAVHEKVRFWNYENRLVVIFAAGGGVYGLDALALFFVMPFVMRDLHLDNAHIGMLSFAMLIGWSISSPAISALSDKLGRRKPFLVGVFVMFAACSALGAVAGSFAILLVSRLLMGLAEGPAVPIQQAMMAAESSPHRRALNMGITQNFGSQLFGALLGPLVMVQLAVTVGWRAAFLISGIPALIIAIVIARFVREPAKANEAILGQGDGRPRLLDLVRCRNVWLAALVGAAMSSWFYLLLTFLPVWSVHELHLSPRVMSVVMSAMGVGGVVSAVIMPWLAERLGRRRVMILTAGLGAAAPLAALAVGAPTALVVLGVFAGSMANAMFPLCCTVAVEAAPPHYAALAAAIVYAISTVIGGVIGPLAAGFLADRFGLATTLWMAVGMAAAAAAASAAIVAGTPTVRRRLQSDKEIVLTST
jgi:MFS family permease